MRKGIMVVFTAPTSPDQDADYNSWYDDTHLSEMLRVPGILSARRLKILPGQSAIQAGWTVLTDLPYVALYEIEAENLAEVGAAVTAAAPTMQLTDALSLNPLPMTIIYESI